MTQNQNLQVIPSSDVNPFQVAAAKIDPTVALMQSRMAQEIQAALVIAQRFPRDQAQAYARIMQACQRQSLAEVAIYSYPRGGNQIEGPSIRLAEALAQNWGNLHYGVCELSQQGGESQCMAYAWDLETNTKAEMTFTIKHERKARGEIVKLEDPRDIYEMMANQGSRRVRSCILRIIPGDICEKAVEKCNDTLKSGAKEPLTDRIRSMVSVFTEFGVTQEMIEGRIQHKVDACSEQELIGLRKIFVSLKDGASKREDWFSVISQSAKPVFSTNAGASESKPAQAKTETEQPATQTTPPATDPAKDDPVKAVETDFATLRKHLEAAQIKPEQFILWVRLANYVSPIADINEIKDSPKKLSWLIKNWEVKKYAEQIRAAKEAA